MSSLRAAVLLVAAGVVAACAPCVLAQNAEVAITVEISDGPVVGHTIAGMLIANETCWYRDHYHFELTMQGELRIHGPILCGKLNAGGGEQVCIVSPEMSCEARKEYSGGAGGSYSVDASGVHSNGKLYAWTDPVKAAQFLASSKNHAASKCDHTLYTQAQEAKRTTPNPPMPETIQLRQACKPMLERVCSAAHGGAALLENGKDVSVLCPR
jgi:hypothetical protein